MNQYYSIQGGRRLEGTVTISGAKNAAVAIIPAAVLAGECCILENLPAIQDVQTLKHILSRMGAQVDFTRGDCMRVDPKPITTVDATFPEIGAMRASYYLLGAMLGAYGEVELALPGGCVIGPRPIDQHIKGLRALGANVYIDESRNVVRAQAKKLKGAEIFFDLVSVGATINLMLAACRAEGQTVLQNVAKEPHVVDVANFLNRMGGDVRGAGTDMIKIRGVSELHGAEYSIIPDQIEAGTFIAAAIATGGDVTVSNITPKHLESIISRMRAVGGDIEIVGDRLRVRRTGPLKPCDVRTRPHPGFPTGMVPQFSVLLSLATGRSRVTEGIWSNRFRFAGELRRMGADIQVDGPVAVFNGVEKLTGAEVTSTDLRAGAAMVIAGLCAEGTTVVEEVEFIERGYQDIVGKLRGLGADIVAVSEPDGPAEPLKSVSAG